MPDRKHLIELEALRGLAAIVVLLHHFMLGFAPRLHGLLYADQPFSLMGTPAFAIINGPAAVIVFFVLSGFVLTIGIFSKPGLPNAVVAIGKRWPRLAGPVILANVFAGCLMAFHLFANADAASKVPSIWLSWWYTWPNNAVLEIVESFAEGATTFFTGKALYNGNLWTMFYEFWGSFIAIGSAVVCNYSRKRAFVIPFLIFVWALLFVTMPFFSTFVVGVGLAFEHLHGEHHQWSKRVFLVTSVITLILLGYHEGLTSGHAEGVYRFINPIARLSPFKFRVLLHSIAATLLILMFMRVPFLRLFFGGRIGRTLGYLSFPIYLSQMLAICSASSIFYLMFLNQSHGLRLLGTFVVTVLFTMIIALPLAEFDRWWVRAVNNMSTNVKSKLSRLQRDREQNEASGGVSR